MGEARRRGTFEQRVATARRETTDRLMSAANRKALPVMSTTQIGAVLRMIFSKKKTSMKKADAAAVEEKAMVERVQGVQDVV